MCPNFFYLVDIFGITIFLIERSEEESLMNDIFLNNVKTHEALSESTIQLALNGLIMNEYEVKDRLQLYSAIISMISMFKCMVDRYSFIRNGQDLGMISFEFIKAVLYLTPPLASVFIFELISWSNNQFPSIIGVESNRIERISN